MGIDRTSPYLKVPASARWRDSMAGRSPESINPHAGPSFLLGAGDRIASAGSCFAQRISESLRARGYNYLITEQGPPFVDEAAKRELGYGVYSARYGNIYTVLQLVQLFQRAFGRFEPQEPLWTNGEGRFVDPFRPGVQPGGFASESECLWDRASHLKAVRRVFEEADVLIFTLGLTESWVSADDGAVFPVCPGAGLGGRFDPERHLFHNFTLTEVVEHLETFLALLAEVNPSARVILTVSPVPLIATFEPRHVLQSTVYSKSVLRVACEEIIRRHDHVHYFASYEIVTATGDTRRYFQDDRREVADEAVAHVIDCFGQQFLGGDAPVAAPAPPPAAVAGPSSNKPLCDENEILKAMADLAASSTTA